jgi:hypothetical protein
MATTLLPFDHPGGPPDLGELCRRLGLPPGVLDEPFGVLPVCEQRGRYAVLVDSRLLEPVRRALSRLQAGAPSRH